MSRYILDSLLQTRGDLYEYMHTISRLAYTARMRMKIHIYYV